MFFVSADVDDDDEEEEEEGESDFEEQQELELHRAHRGGDEGPSARDIEGQRRLNMWK